MIQMTCRLWISVYDFTPIDRSIDDNMPKKNPMKTHQGSHGVIATFYSILSNGKKLEHWCFRPACGGDATAPSLQCQLQAG